MMAGFLWNEHFERDVDFLRVPCRLVLPLAMSGVSFPVELSAQIPWTLASGLPVRRLVSVDGKESILRECVYLCVDPP